MKRIKFELEWEQIDSENYLGKSESLPDCYCNFRIEKKAGRDYFQAIPPNMNTESYSKKLPFEDFESAAQFCKNFLNVNTRTILNYQIENMRGSGSQTEKPIRYYENIRDNLPKDQ